MTASSSRRLATFLLSGLLVAFVLAGIVSGFADSDPDGLERVAVDNGFADTAQEHALADSPLADYGVKGVDNPRLSGGLAGVVGVTLTFGLGLATFSVVSRRKGQAEAAADASTASASS